MGHGGRSSQDKMYNSGRIGTKIKKLIQNITWLPAQSSG
jgi:hypothetical protein